VICATGRSCRREREYSKTIEGLTIDLHLIDLLSSGRLGQVRSAGDAATVRFPEVHGPGVAPGAGASTKGCSGVGGSVVAMVDELWSGIVGVPPHLAWVGRVRHLRPRQRLDRAAFVWFLNDRPKYAARVRGRSAVPPLNRADHLEVRRVEVIDPTAEVRPVHQRQHAAPLDNGCSRATRLQTAVRTDDDRAAADLELVEHDDMADTLGADTLGLVEHEVMRESVEVDVAGVARIGVDVVVAHEGMALAEKLGGPLGVELTALLDPDVAVDPAAFAVAAADKRSAGSIVMWRKMSGSGVLRKPTV
jgi:hypothetical protein